MTSELSFNAIRPACPSGSLDVAKYLRATTGPMSNRDLLKRAEKPDLTAGHSIELAGVMS
jgi:hypothetical protein